MPEIGDSELHAFAQDLGTHLNSIKTSTQIVIGDLERSHAILTRLLETEDTTTFITQKPEAILRLLRKMSKTISQTQDEHARILEHCEALEPILESSLLLAGDTDAKKLVSTPRTTRFKWFCLKGLKIPSFFRN